MIEQLARFRSFVWAVIEALFQLDILCLLLSVVLGTSAGYLIGGVAHNAIVLLNAIPQGAMLALLVIYLVYLYFRHRRGT